MPTDNVAKDFKDYEGKIASYSTNGSKSKKVLMMIFPIILPLAKGTTLKEGHIEENTVYDSLVLPGVLYIDWAYLNIRSFVVY